jgi:hypothetical protein
MPARQAHDPLKGARWQQGTEPTAAPAEAQPEAEQVIDAHSVDWGMQMRATAIVRRLYGIDQLEWGRNAKLYDRVARKIYELLRRGEPIPEHYRPSYKEPEAINPDSWQRLGYW